MKKYPMMIVDAPPEGEDLIVRAPFDGSEIATVATGGPGAVEKALTIAEASFLDRDNWLPCERRIGILERTAQIMSEEADELAMTAAREGGKPLVDSRVEVARAIDGIKICIEVLRTQAGEEIPMGLNAASTNRLAFTRHEPIGVVVAVSAFNHPLNLIVHQVAPAVAVGCPVIVKPAGATALSCVRFVEILREAGLPEAWCQVLVTKDRNAATQLVTDPRVAFFSFIGSPGVGWKLNSQLAPGTRCALEHGGAAPAIVAKDADLDDAIPLLAKGGFYHAGQVCVSVQRVFAHESIARDVATKLAESAAAMKVGDPTLPDTDIGPLIRPAEVDRVETWVREAVDGGAELVCGGKRISDSCFPCTVLYDPPADAKVSRQEIFGPVVCVHPFAEIDDVIQIANALPFAFQAAVFTKDIDLAMKAYSRLSASAVMVNDHTAFRVDWMPFAGLKQSGLGTGGIPHTMEDMQISKMLVLRSGKL